MLRTFSDIGYSCTAQDPTQIAVYCLPVLTSLKISVFDHSAFTRQVWKYRTGMENNDEGKGVDPAAGKKIVGSSAKQ